MALILCLETATPVCSVALVKDGHVLALREEEGQQVHAARITLFVEEVMKETGYKLDELNAVAVSKGPGSYTGLRVGASAAKGFCYALGKPMLAIHSLEALAYGFLRRKVFSPSGAFYLAPMFDARRMEVFCAVFDEELNNVETTSAKVIDAQSFENLLQERQLVFFGTGAEKCKGTITAPNAVFVDSFKSSAAHMAALAEKHFAQKIVADVAYFEPYYLKDFVGTTPRKI